MPKETAFNLAVILLSWCPQHSHIFLLWGTFFTLGSKEELAHAKSDKYGGWLIRTMLPWSIHSPLPCAPFAELWECREQTLHRSSSFPDKQFQELCCFWGLFSRVWNNHCQLFHNNKEQHNLHMGLQCMNQLRYNIFMLHLVYMSSQNWAKHKSQNFTVWLHIRWYSLQSWIFKKIYTPTCQ